MKADAAKYVRKPLSMRFDALKVGGREDLSGFLHQVKNRVSVSGRE